MTDDYLVIQRKWKLFCVFTKKFKPDELLPSIFYSHVAVKCYFGFWTPFFQSWTPHCGWNGIHDQNNPCRFDSNLTSRDHIWEKYSTVYWVLLIETFTYEHTFVLPYKTMICPHVEFANTVWCPFKLSDIKDIDTKRLTKQQKPNVVSVLINLSLWSDSFIRLRCKLNKKLR